MVYKINGRRFFSDILAKNIDKQTSRVEDEYPSCIIIDGGVGKSKTCSARQIADYISIKRGHEEIDLKKQLARGGKELFEKATICIKEKLPVLIYDEAGDFSKKRVLTDFNLALSRFFEQYRQFGINLIVCLPLMDTLDRTLLDLEVVRFLIHVERRTASSNDCKVFSLHRLYYLKAKMKKLEQKSFAYKIIRCNFFCHINRLPRELEEDLKKFSLQGKKTAMNEVNIIANKLVSYVDIANRLNKSLPWVRAAIAQNKLKPKQKINRANYYDRQIISFLADYNLKKK